MVLISRIQLKKSDCHDTKNQQIRNEGKCDNTKIRSMRKRLHLQMPWCYWKYVNGCPMSASFGVLHEVTFNNCN